MSELEKRWQAGKPVILDGAIGHRAPKARRRDTPSAVVELGIDRGAGDGAGNPPGVLGGGGGRYYDQHVPHPSSVSSRGGNGGARQRARSHRRRAQSAREEASVEALVASSITPLEDCYHPEGVPPRDRLKEEHAEIADNLAGAGADLLLVETMGTLDELDAAAGAAQRTGLPVMVSVIPVEGAKLIGGQPLDEVLDLFEPQPPVAFMVNCANHRVITEALGHLSRAETPISLGGYANMGTPEDEKGWSFTHEVSPRDYAGKVMEWVRLGAPGGWRMLRNHAGSHSGAGARS